MRHNRTVKNPLDPITIEDRLCGFCVSILDTCWVARGGADPALWIRRLRKRIDQVHVKDTVMLEGKGAVFAEVGEGNLNWPRILKACKAAGVRDYIVEQDSCPITNDPFKSIAISYDNLRKAGLR